MAPAVAASGCKYYVVSCAKIQILLSAAKMFSLEPGLIKSMQWLPWVHQKKHLFYWCRLCGCALWVWCSLTCSSAQRGSMRCSVGRWCLSSLRLITLLVAANRADWREQTNALCKTSLISERNPRKTRIGKTAETSHFPQANLAPKPASSHCESEL